MSSPEAELWILSHSWSTPSGESGKLADPDALLMSKIVTSGVVEKGVLGEDVCAGVPSENEETVGPDIVALGSEVCKSVKVPKEGVGVDKLGSATVGWIEGAWVGEMSREVEFS